MTDWQGRAKALADRLDLGDRRWREAFAAVPRHLFVPRFYADPATPVDGADPAQRDGWLDAVYSDETLVIRYAPVGDTGLRWATSSSTMPSLMAGMLDLLDVHDGHRVLEVGTGTGYNAALLCHRLAGSGVASIDLDPELVEAARRRLAALGWWPHLAVGDGAAGCPEAAPFDRIIATCAVRAVPPAWIGQLRPGGLIVADVRGSVSGGLVVVRADAAGSVSGRFVDRPGHFMWLRREVGSPLRDSDELRLVYDASNRTERTTDLDRAVLDDADFRFLLQLHDLALASMSWSGDTLSVRTEDGAMADLDTATGTVMQAGPRHVWDTVEQVADLWHRLGRPARHRFGLTAGVDGTHRCWLDNPARPVVAR